MHHSLRSVVGMFLAGMAVSCLAAESPGKKPGPCDEVQQACTSAGFKAGTGLWSECIDPIMQGVPQPAAAKIPLPKVSPETVSACKEKHPQFGQKKHKS